MFKQLAKIGEGYRMSRDLFVLPTIIWPIGYNPGHRAAREKAVLHIGWNGLLMYTTFISVFQSHNITKTQPLNMFKYVNFYVDLL